MLKKKKNQVIGLDIGSRTIKVAEVADTKKGGVLKKFGSIEIPTGLIEDGAVRNPEEVADAIREMFKMYKIKEPNVAVSIGGYSIIVKTITVQKMDEDQLHETIQFEAEQYIPFDINDVNIDFQMLGENESNPSQMNVLLVAAKKEMVNDYVSLVQLANLNPVVVDVDAFALQNIYEMNSGGEENVALIDVGASKTTLNIVKNTVSVLMRDVSFGCHQINQKIISLIGCSVEEAEKIYQEESSDKIQTKDLMEILTGVTTDWCAEISRALDFFYSTYPGDQINRIVLSGGGANIKKFRQLLTKETSTDVELINPFANFSVEGGLDHSYLEQIAPQAAICMGLAIRRVGDK